MEIYLRRRLRYKFLDGEQTSHMGACGNRRAYSVFCRKNMKLAAGLIADRVYKFESILTLRSWMEPRSSSYFLLQNNCMPFDYRRLWVGSLHLRCDNFKKFILRGNFNFSDSLASKYENRQIVTIN